MKTPQCTYCNKNMVLVEADDQIYENKCVYFCEHCDAEDVFYADFGNGKVSHALYTNFCDARYRLIIQELSEKSKARLYKIKDKNKPLSTYNLSGPIISFSEIPDVNPSNIHLKIGTYLMMI